MSNKTSKEKRIDIFPLPPQKKRGGDEKARWQKYEPYKSHTRTYIDIMQYNYTLHEEQQYHIYKNKNQ